MRSYSQITSFVTFKISICFAKCRMQNSLCKLKREDVVEFLNTCLLGAETFYLTGKHIRHMSVYARVQTDQLP